MLRHYFYVQSLPNYVFYVQDFFHTKFPHFLTISDKAVQNFRRNYNKLPTGASTGFKVGWAPARSGDFVPNLVSARLGKGRRIARNKKRFAGFA